MTTYGILLFTDAEELDAIGPWEIFTASAMLRAQDAGSAVDEVLTVAASLEPVRMNKGLRVLPDATLADHPDLDVVLVPGGVGTYAVQDDAATLAWLRKVDGSSTWTSSVCTGSFLLHASGVADGKRLATHWLVEDGLAEAGADVERRYRWVVDGKVVSSQGVSAGIDMALWLVGAVPGPDPAREVQRYVQYDPAPPYQHAS